MDSNTALALLAALTQAGFGAAAWRLATKIDARQTKHEVSDEQFQRQVRLKLDIAQED